MSPNYARVSFKGRKKKEARSRNHGLKIDFGLTFDEDELNDVIAAWLLRNMNYVDKFSVKVVVYSVETENDGDYEICHHTEVISYMLDFNQRGNNSLE